MKRITLFLLSFMILSVTFAQWQNSDNNRRYPNNNNYGNSALAVQSFNQQQFMVTVDNGYSYQSNGNNNNNNTVYVNNLSAGNHTVTVYQWKRNFFGKQRQEVIYNSNLYFKPGMETMITINNFGQVNIEERQLYQNNDNGNWGNNGNGNAWGKKKHKHKKHKHNNCGRDDDDDRRRNDWNGNWNNQ
jgi:hypothetical protein